MRMVCPAPTLEQQWRSLIEERIQEIAAQVHWTTCEARLVAARVLGLGSKECARKLGISINTHKTEVRSILRKLGASSMDEVRDLVLRSLGAAA
jgi:DNA-binding NarL/FixJ family response regulator